MHWAPVSVVLTLPKESPAVMVSVKAVPAVGVGADRLKPLLGAALTTKLVEAGLASWGGGDRSSLIVKGQANLLEDISALTDLERLRALFDALETKETMVRLLDATREGEGVQIYIGADNPLFGMAGCSMVVAPYTNSREQVVGAIGVVGPTRINYARIIPMVDYTARVISKLLGG